MLTSLEEGSRYRLRSIPSGYFSPRIKAGDIFEVTDVYGGPDEPRDYRVRFEKYDMIQYISPHLLEKEHVLVEKAEPSLSMTITTRPI